MMTRKQSKERANARRALAQARANLAFDEISVRIVGTRARIKPSKMLTSDLAMFNRLMRKLAPLWIDARFELSMRFAEARDQRDKEFKRQSRLAAGALARGLQASARMPKGNGHDTHKPVPEPLTISIPDPAPISADQEAFLNSLGIDFDSAFPRSVK